MLLPTFSHIQGVLFAFAALFPVLNPLAGAMIFLNFTHGLPTKTLNKLAKQVGINTFVLLSVVLLIGSWLLSFFGITIPIVQIGGGFIVASMAWQVLQQPIAAREEAGVESTRTDKDVKEMAFFPLTMPLTAGPGCIAVTLTLGAGEIHHKWVDTVAGQISSAIGILLAAISVWLCYRYAERVTKYLGETGSRIIMRLSAFINLCIGLQIVWNGVKGLLTTIL